MPPALMGTYARSDLRLVRGEGSWVFDASGRRWLDFLGGISVLGLGHCHPRLVDALCGQARELWHVSNLFQIPAQEELARRLVERCFADQVFFCNSGTEAVEASLKLARLASSKIHGRQRKVFVAMERSFHGRSFGSLSVTGQTKYREPFEPLLDEVRFCAYGDIEALKKVVAQDVAAIIMEPLQAEGGLVSPPPGYLRQVRELCDERGVFLIFDEVQVGMGRTGVLFAHQAEGVEPDIMALAKGLAGGFPMGAMLARHQLSRFFEPGTHASTFGGNPLACRVALEVLDIIDQREFLEILSQRCRELEEGLQKLKGRHPMIEDLRGRGMLRGFGLDRPVAPLVKGCADAGLIVGSAGPQVLRLAPALNIDAETLGQGLDLLDRALGEWRK